MQDTATSGQFFLTISCSCLCTHFTIDEEKNCSANSKITLISFVLAIFLLTMLKQLPSFCTCKGQEYEHYSYYSCCYMRIIVTKIGYCFPAMSQQFVILHFLQVEVFSLSGTDRWYSTCTGCVSKIDEYFQTNWWKFFKHL